MSKIKVGIIGCGTIANNAHIPSYMNNPDVEITYFCDANPEKANDAIKKYGVGKAVTDYREVITDPEIEAISVCTPNNMHATISIEALKAGKHVLCEKPAARTYEEALLMQKAQKEYGKILNIGVVNRFRTGVLKVKELIDAGELGNVYHVYASFRAHRSIPGIGGDFTNSAISGGGVLIDWGVHFLDLVMFCLGDPEPKTVSGQAYSILGRNIKDYAYINMWSRGPKLDGVYDVEDFITGLIRTEKATISLNGAWAQNIGVDELYVDFLGDKAGIRLQYGAGFKLYTFKNDTLYEVIPSFKMQNEFQAEIDAFINCIKTGEKIASNIDNVIITAKIMQALYDSSKAGREIVF